jgi:hypothetical protein
MQKIFLVAAAIACVATNAQAGEYHFVGTGNHAGIFVDEASLTREGDARTFVMVGVNFDVSERLAYAVAKTTINCSSKTTFDNYAVSYDNNGDVIAQRLAQSDATPIIPDSNMDTIRSWACASTTVHHHEHWPSNISALARTTRDLGKVAAEAMR